MRKSMIWFSLIALFVCAASVQAQGQVYTTESLEYSLEMPSPTWKLISGREATREHPEFLNGDKLNGYLRVRKETVDAGTTVSDLARRDLEQKFRYLPGFVEGKEEKFNGRMDGVTVSYEFTQTGKPMMGRVYFLQSDSRTVYALYFTGLRETLARIRNQTDLIARSFKLK
ncbi:MAG TPA: hypothetical protein VGN86_08830 [Pyrinomonadaceae bacterium]|jgi:hypothetical protein|nr:hypothetical protein [Pyrinomonadaceae bacterium]